MKITLSLFAPAAVAAVCSVAAIGQSAGGVATFPQPPSPSLSQIEAEARRSAQRPGDRPRTLSVAELKGLQALLAPNVDDVQAYKDLLKQGNSGIVRLFPDDDCVRKNVVRVDGECANHVPGASGMSFRGKSANHDIRFSNDELIADGFFSVGAIVNLGDVELDSVDVNSRGVGFLYAFEPPQNLQNAIKDLLIIRAGETRPPYHYSDRAKARKGDSYAVRIVAFDADNIGIKRLGRDRKGIADWDERTKFSALRDDNRGDVLAAFRIVRIDLDGSITIVWKLLAKKKAPKLRFEDDQVLSDFK